MEKAETNFFQFCKQNKTEVIIWLAGISTGLFVIYFILTSPPGWREMPMAPLPDTHSTSPLEAE